jgi:2-polyprenyl-3-methyl-5-hydroxy-6-metoxy-1,4-benzoquinol methylase
MALPLYTHHNPLIRWIMFRRLDAVMELVNDAMHFAPQGPGRTGLDFGCGVGLLIPSLANRLERLYLTDTCLEGARALARQYGCQNVEFLEPTEVARAIPDRSLALITAADTLQHVEELEDIVRIFRDKVAPWGRLIISGPTESVVYKLCRRMAGATGGQPIRRNIASIEEALARRGFRLMAQRRLPFPVLPDLFRISLFALR